MIKIQALKIISTRIGWDNDAVECGIRLGWLFLRLEVVKWCTETLRLKKKMLKIERSRINLIGMSILVLVEVFEKWEKKDSQNYMFTEYYHKLIHLNTQPILFLTYQIQITSKYQPNHIHPSQYNQ